MDDTNKPTIWGGPCYKCGSTLCAGNCVEHPPVALPAVVDAEVVAKKQCEHGARSEAMCSICSRR